MIESTKNSTLLGDALLEAIRQAVREEIATALANGIPKGDHLIDRKKAAKLLDVSEPWLYANWKRLPFARKVGNALKFSHAGIQKYIAKRP